jgi:uncharacterized protein (TIGR02757 family)
MAQATHILIVHLLIVVAAVYLAWDANKGSSALQTWIPIIFAAIFSWGNRTTIIKKSRELLQLMDNAPHQFCLSHTENDLKKLMQFKHRTFNTTDLLYFIEFFTFHYNRYDSLEEAFCFGMKENDINVSNALNSFYEYFFSLPDIPKRTLKHVASPNKNSACKRINMFLRWMVRDDNKGVDFGLWKKIKPSQLIIPLDLHVSRVAHRFNLLERKQFDWIAAVELTDQLKTWDDQDPTKYDFALFALGIEEKF